MIIHQTPASISHEKTRSWLLTHFTFPPLGKRRLRKRPVLIHYMQPSAHNLLLPPTTILCPFPNHCTASPTISSTIAFALFFSFTTAAALPIKYGRALSIVSSSMSSPRVSKSCSTGMVPLAVRDLISEARFSSQFWMYGLFRTRRGRPYGEGKWWKLLVRLLIEMKGY